MNDGMSGGAIGKFLGSSPGRIGLGLAVMSALTVFLWPESSWRFDIEKGLAVLAALVVWLWAEVEAGRVPHPHDIELFTQLRKTVSSAERQNLAEHDFGNSFHKDTFKGIGEVYDAWRGSSYEFHDRKLQRRWASLKSKLDGLTTMMMMSVGPVPGNHAVFTVKTHQDISSGTRSQTTLENAAKLNAASQEAATAFDDFERLARSRLGI